MKQGFTLPEWIDPETWRDFEDMRQKIRKPLTDAARRLAVRRLLEIWNEYGHHPQMVLEQSILNAWQGIWPLSKGRVDRVDRREEELQKELRVGAGPVCLGPVTRRPQ